MRRINVKTIKGNERLSRSIYSESDVVLVAEGTILKKEYINRLLELGIHYVYINDEIGEDIEYKDIVQTQTRENCINEVKLVLGKYSTYGKADFSELTIVAEDIITDILAQKEVLVNIIDIREKDEYTYSHSVNVCALSVLISLKLGLNKKRVREIALGALLHDVGKTLIQDIYLTNKNEISDRELIEYKKHVIYGYDAVKDQIWLSNQSKNIILSHHERINGTGYPFGWTGDKIKLGTKIVAICDVFDSMVYGAGCDRVYKIYEIIEYFIGQAGILYDKDILEVFIDNIAVYPSGTGVLTNEGEVGIVIRQNNGFPSRPVIRMIRDSQGNDYDKKVIVDLTENLTIFIDDTVEIY